MTEWDFLAAVAAGADCGILLDVNNVFVSAFNHGFDPSGTWTRFRRPASDKCTWPDTRTCGTYLFDTHSAPVSEPVWRLYEYAVARFGPVSTLVEWDAEIPSFERLIAEGDRARTIAEVQHAVAI